MIRLALVILGLALCSWKFATGFIAAETIRAEGEEVLFELAPVDPRELFLGDYMTLRYDLGLRRLDDGSEPVPIPDRLKGLTVMRIEDGVGKIIRFDQTETLAANERLIRIGGDRYYFQSGTGDRFAEADYGIFRVMPDGRALLSGLADEKKRPILIAGEAPLEALED
jgi:uncharacterized membrane-anchored protein